MIFNFGLRSSSKLQIELVSTALTPVARRWLSGATPVQKKRVHLNGVFSAVAVPFTGTGDVDLAKFERNFDKWERDATLSGYAVGGSNGEVNTLSPSERISLVAAARRRVAPNKLIIGGATAESTRLTIEMCKGMSEMGADAVLVLSPFYFKSKMTESAIRRHFEAVADESPVPVVIYNNPFVSNIDLSLDTLAWLANHENIQGVKGGDVRKMGYLSMKTKDKNFDILIASAGYILPALQLELYTLVKENKLAEAKGLQMRIIPPDVLLLAELGVPGVKAAMNIVGYEGGYCRAPLPEVTNDALLKIEHILKDNGFLYKEERMETRHKI
ncbi:hypothetical protein LSTR_LSTR008721 [Laodelphax striatellus]|uniref:4-hydroxy-2-oxoglutarate aldolase, mitochondrial n=1 Tax=Laodelphax striatellus TaxID=195883 RepID=A0A482XQT7_LAOST|nr:hypothetical protein LSTR_LSTR008721 [Laodelphax striatellus]